MKISTVIDFNKKEQAAAVKQITGMKTLFRAGKGWIQGDEKDKDKNGNNTYCLVGALDEVNGTEIAMSAIGMAIDASVMRDNIEVNPFDGFVLDERSAREVLIAYNDVPSRT